MAKGTIRHPAIVAKDPEKLADYYRKVFSIEEFHRDNKAKKPGGKIGVFLTDDCLDYLDRAEDKGGSDIGKRPANW